VSNPPNPWVKGVVEYLGEIPEVRLEVYEDRSRSILTKNDSPDVGFTYGVNPYRGCFHGCAYCYARPGHEYLGFGAGTDFERKIVVKPEAPALLRRAFEKKSWRGEAVAFSGVTDCYQPLEASYRLTRGCLEVCVEMANPAGIITKAPLIERDVDVLQELGRRADVAVTVSVPFWDPDKARAMEPYVATPKRRIRTIETLAKAGVRVGVNIAPVIPGLSDQEIPQVLKAAREAGASWAGWVLLKLPGPVAQVFPERLRAALPLTADRVLHRIRETRQGALNDARFGVRGRGEGPYAAIIARLFEAAAARVGFAAGEREKSEAMQNRMQSRTESRTEGRTERRTERQIQRQKESPRQSRRPARGLDDLPLFAHASSPRSASKSSEQAPRLADHRTGEDPT